MKQYIARTLIVLLIATHSSTFDDDYDGDYSQEDIEYDTYFDKYDPGNHMDWGAESTQHGKLNLKGTVRKLFALGAISNNQYISTVCSPISVILSLGKLALGAEGRCLTQLLNAVGLKTKKELKKAFKPVINGLKHIKGVRLHLISKIYVSNDVRLRSKFRRRARKIFQSSVVAMDFKKPAAAARNINQWVKRQTRHGIENVISEHDLSPQTSLLLVNAVYFAGFWEYEFDKVSESNFYTAYDTRKISMMTRHGNYKYGKSDSLDSQLVEIPFEGGKASFVIILPNNKDGLSTLLQKIDLAPGLLQEPLRRMHPTDLILSIPKFRTEVIMNLNAVFSELRLTEIFKRHESGLEKIVKGEKNIHLSKAVHRAVIVLNELGAKAASSSVLNLAVITSNLNRIIFNANRPFLYFVLFEGEQLFTGAFVN